VIGVVVIGITAIAITTVLGRQAPATLFTFLLVATALAITAGVEVIVLKGDIGRMNTVFKFYVQVWLLLSISVGVMLTLMVRRAWGSRWLVSTSGARQAIAIVLALVLVSTLVYPLMGIPAKLAFRFNPLPPTLDGMQYMQTAKYEDNNKDLQLPDDFKAINWMLDNISGSPVIVEGIAPLYHWRSRVSIYTGLPTVLGWDWHQKQQRGDFGYMVDDRGRDVDAIFTSPDADAKLRLLRKYGVQYVYVGGQERAFYSAAGIARFDSMVGSSLERIYQEGAVTIYRVVQ
jgi:YYY domain-containing protein